MLFDRGKCVKTQKCSQLGETYLSRYRIALLQSGCLVFPFPTFLFGYSWNNFVYGKVWLFRPARLYYLEIQSWASHGIIKFLVRTYVYYQIQLVKYFVIFIYIYIYVSISSGFCFKHCQCISRQWSLIEMLMKSHNVSYNVHNMLVKCFYEYRARATERALFHCLSCHCEPDK